MPNTSPVSNPYFASTTMYYYVIGHYTTKDPKMVKGQLADNPTCRHSSSPTNQLAEIDILTFRLTQKCNGNYENSVHLLYIHRF